MTLLYNPQIVGSLIYIIVHCACYIRIVRVLQCLRFGLMPCGIQIMDHNRCWYRFATDLLNVSMHQRIQQSAPSSAPQPHHRPCLARSMCEKVVNIHWSVPQAHKQSKSPGAWEWKYNWPSHFSLVCTLPLSCAQIFSFSRYTIIE
jgi:hypothetical protein